MPLQGNADDRLARLLEEAELEHQLATSNGAGSGNREFERTQGATSALTRAKEVLTAEIDPTLTQVEAYAVSRIIREKLFGVLTILKGNSAPILHIGDINELKPYKIGITHIDHEVLEKLTGTRIEVLRQFLEKYRQQA